MRKLILPNRIISEEVREMYIEQNAFEKTVDMYSDMLLRVAFTYCGNKSDSEDIVQEVFLKYLKKQPKFDSEEHKKAWLIRVTVNLCKDLLKSYWFRNKSELTEQIPVCDDDNKFIWDYVQRLSPKYRIVIELFYKEGYSIKEIADILHKNQSTIGNQLARAKKLLEKQMKEDL